MDRNKLTPEHARIAEQASAEICAGINRIAVAETVVVTFPDQPQLYEQEILDIAN